MTSKNIDTPVVLEKHTTAKYTLWPETEKNLDKATEGMLSPQYGPHSCQGNDVDEKFSEEATTTTNIKNADLVSIDGDSGTASDRFPIVPPLRVSKKAKPNVAKKHIPDAYDDLQVIKELASQEKKTSLDPRANHTLDSKEIARIEKEEWLGTEHINAALALLRTQFPNIGGLFNVQWGQSIEFPAVESTCWIQILHTGTNHWITAANGFGNNDNILVYDSMGNIKPNTHTVYCVANMHHTDKDFFKISMMPRQNQQDGFNCGPFAIFAFATTLAFNLNPSEIIFNKDEMRKHLMRCISSGNMEPFPTLPGFRRNSKWRHNTQWTYEVHCNAI
ncbi:LOW QUALITY PROTEIN: hypothetical protein GHT06_001927 [Daphnia sinensis]|uniref:Ubiquitin-like protease family profile domain-containing protein n=1 Tax=Daphnia sinensis TaxID=1820382 RepID=A0AAD5KG19_9CRUS|nr:LOW QUALITY PROTEIN: hypothetical protein GHT06_001927 [Daphnia sinensis]